MDNYERVKKWAAGDGEVGHVEDLQVAGLEFFAVTRPAPADGRNSQGVAVVTDSGKILVGETALRAAIAQTDDAFARAFAAMLLLRGWGRPLKEASTDAHRSAGVSAPIESDDEIAFYYEESGVGGVELMKATFNTSTLALETKPAARPADGDPVAKAKEMLESGNSTFHQQAIDMLANTCGELAVGLLESTVASHSHAEARAHAASAIGRCHGSGSVGALIKALESDKENDVRWRAATSLGEIGDNAATSALTKASKDPDESVSYAAKTALQKL